LSAAPLHAFSACPMPEFELLGQLEGAQTVGIAVKRLLKD